jgi:hypothetical protein
MKNDRFFITRMLVVLLGAGLVLAGCASTGEPAPTTATLSIRDGTPGDAGLELVLSAGKWKNPGSRSSWFTYDPEEGRPNSTKWNLVSNSVLVISFSAKDWTGTVQLNEARLAAVAEFTNLQTLTLGTNDPVNLVVKP